MVREVLHDVEAVYRDAGIGEGRTGDELHGFGEVHADVDDLAAGILGELTEPLQHRLGLDPADDGGDGALPAVGILVGDKRVQHTAVHALVYRQVKGGVPLVGFRSLSSRESNLDRINILISLMGDQNIDILRSIYNHFQPSDMFPVLPFPSKAPRHSDYLMLKYHGFFTEKQFTEPQNVTYADEQNPFELYLLCQI